MMSAVAGLPDEAGARAYARDLLARRLPHFLTYHNLWHTLDEVIPRTQWIAEREGLDTEATLLACTGAAYHDVGFTRQYLDHERVGAQMAASILPQFGYTEAQIRRVQAIIMATKLPQAPTSLPARIVADADLDVLGREDFFIRGTALRAERIAVYRASTEGPGAADSAVSTESHPEPVDTLSDLAWYTGQARFLAHHRYFTRTAREDRAAGRSANLRELHARLDALRGAEGVPALFTRQAKLTQP